MKTSRRDFIANAGAAAAAMHDLAHAQEPEHEHDHSVVPSDPALRVKSLESLLVEKGLVDPAALDTLIDASGGASLGGSRVQKAFARQRHCGHSGVRF